MERFCIAIIAVLLCAISAGAGQNLELKADQMVDQSSEMQSLGSLNVEGIGMVKLTARRSGTQLIVQAVNSENMLIGLAESVVGTVETPIYITTPSGLTQLRVIWKNP